LDSLNVDVHCKNVEKLPDITFVVDGIKLLNLKIL